MESNEKISELLENVSNFFKLKEFNHPAILELNEILMRYPSDLEIPVNIFELLIKNLVTFPSLNILKSKITEEFQGVLNHTILGLNDKISMIEEKCLGLEHRIESAKKKFGNDYENIQRKMNEIQSYLSNKPWIKDIIPISEELTMKPSFEDLYSVKIVLQPRLDEIESLSKKAEKSIKDFEGALARMDEILLTKSSKEDIKYLNTQFDNYVRLDYLENVLPELTSRINSLEDFEKRHKSHMNDLQGEGCSKISHRNTSKDFSVLFNKMNSISQMLESKIDKVEILPLLESNELKDITFRRALDSLLLDFQQIAVLQQETLKTMMRSLDSAEKKNKQRSDLLKASEKLVGNITLKLSDNKGQMPSKSASFARNSQSPEIPERIIATNLSRNSNRKAKRQVYGNKTNRNSLNL